MSLAHLEEVDVECEDMSGSGLVWAALAAARLARILASTPFSVGACFTGR